MSDALRDMTQAEVTPDYLRRRVDDWEARVIGLYDLLESWLPPDCTATRARSISMHEELMQQYCVSPRRLPILDVLRKGRSSASVVPSGLWIIGVNGRLDLRSNKGTFVIIDRSPAFQAPAWHMAPLADRTRVEPLTEAAFRAVL